MSAIQARRLQPQIDAAADSVVMSEEQPVVVATPSFQLDLSKWSHERSLTCWRSTLPETMAGSPPADRLGVDATDSEADYSTPLPSAVLNSPYRCVRCRHGATAHTRISDCAAVTMQRVVVALRQGHRITPCPECSGPVARSLHTNGGAVCLRCEARPNVVQVRSRIVVGSRPTCSACGKRFTRTKNKPGATRCKPCRMTGAGYR
jgi:hypothetical protein